MKTLATALLLATFTLLATTAEAGSGSHGLYGKSQGYALQARPLNRQPYRPTHGQHRPPAVGHAHPHHQRALKRSTGVIVLGPVITTLDAPRHGVVVITRPSYPSRPAYSVRHNRWYQRDAFGDCFEVRLQRDGQQVWTQVRPARCR